ncbi:histidine kinase [Pseudoalteromonas sp. S1727]|uniref:FecR domain-containing protein n=1 Tax=Pseudoalteromonas sp. S1727 TaxID=2066514 RepID=UPI0011086F1A|nr:FecR domain-containing protein [Pseudoalteromonas sp. S1727]TMN70933.1 histidine kinase [Pseudoalteromonas sp. S1727]
MAKISPDTIQQAATWMARLWADDVSQSDKNAFQIWYQAQPENALAWQQLEQLQATFLKAPQSKLSRTVLSRTVTGVSRRQALLLGLFTLGNLGLIFAGRAEQPNGQKYTTAIGETKTVTLKDGTVIALNTETAVYLDSEHLEHRLHLLKGEIWVASAQDGASLYVTTRDGKVVPIGTVFTVRQQEHDTVVSVYEGIVELRPLQTAQLIQLKAMQQAAFSRKAIMPVGNLHSSKALWLEHKIQANSSKLTDFIAELSRYRRGIVRVSPELAKYRVTGTFSTKNTDKALLHLSEILPIEVDYRSSLWVSIKERK